MKLLEILSTAGTCLIVRDSILTGINEKRLSRNNQVVKVRDFRGATIDDLKHHLVPLLKNTLLNT